MADNSQPRSLPQQPRRKRPRHGVRYQMELIFDNDEGKFSFLSRLDSAKRRLATLSGRKTLDHRELLSALLDIIEGGCGQDTDAIQQCSVVTGASNEAPSQTVAALPMLDNSGM